MTKLASLSVLAVAACWSATQPTPQTPPVDEVHVEVASVALADDCPDPGRVAAVPEGPSQSSVACAQGYDCSSRRSSCEQTTIQLVVRANDRGAKIAIKRIELIDPAGKSLGTMTARNPTRWTDDGTYVAWNEAVDPRQQITASYALGLPAGPLSLDVSGTYRVRVTLSIGGEDRTVEKQATRIAPAMVEPGVVT